MADKFAGVREALRQESPPSPLWQIQHVDITCDGCENEPIIGHRFKCCVCEDIDLCGSCMRALVAARVKMTQEVGSLPAPQSQGSRPRRWVHKLRSKDLAAKWAALQTAVPCLHPSHRFAKITDGPERAVVFLAGSSSSSGDSSNSSSGGSNSSSGTSTGGGSNGAGGLDTFLATFPPSLASCQDVAWIVVDHRSTERRLEQQLQQLSVSSIASGKPGAAQGPDGGRGGGSNSTSASRASGGPGSASLEDRVDAAVEEWEQLVGTGRRPTAADVDRLAAKHGILKGKWMLFARSGHEADAAWAAVARAVCGLQPAAAAQQAAGTQAGQRQGEQQQQQQQRRGQQDVQCQEQRDGHAVGGTAGPLCQSAKVSSSSPDGSWVLCVYTEDYQDSADVERVCRGLQRAIPVGMLQDRRMLYKADIYTYLGIYARNEWQLKPTILEARLS